jgi:hypothetical protein
MHKLMTGADASARDEAARAWHRWGFTVRHPSLVASLDYNINLFKSGFGELLFALPRAHERRSLTAASRTNASFYIQI